MYNSIDDDLKGRGLPDIYESYELCGTEISHCFRKTEPKPGTYSSVNGKTELSRGCEVK